MNEFDDLFEDRISTANQDNNIDDFYNNINLQKRNGLLLIIYIVANLVFTFGSILFFSMQYPDSNAIISNIIVNSEPNINVNYDDNSQPVSADIDGSFINNSNYKLPKFWVKIELFDKNNESLGIFTFSKENFLINDTFSFNENISITGDPVKYEMHYGIDENTGFYVIVSLLQVFFTGLLFIYFDYEAFKQNWIEFKNSVGKYFGKIVLGFGMVFASLYLAQMILEALNITQTSENEMTIQSMFTTDPIRLIILFFLLCIFTPIVEEVVFRKVIYNFLQSKAGHLVAIIGSGIIFGLMHVISYGDFIQSIPYIFMGITFGYVFYMANKNIYVTIGVHFLNNFLTYSIYILMLYGLIQS